MSSGRETPLLRWKELEWRAKALKWEALRLKWKALRLKMELYEADWP